MSRRAAKFKQVEIRRAIRAAKSAGMNVGEVIIGPDGSIRVIATDIQPSQDEDRFQKEFRARHGYA